MEVQSIILTDKTMVFETNEISLYVIVRFFFTSQIELYLYDINLYIYFHVFNGNLLQYV
jgi:hypothetical protein